MRYYVKCNNINNNKEIQLLDENGNLVFYIHKQVKVLKKSCDIKNANNERIFHVNFYPLKVKNRYLLKDQSDKVVINIDMGGHLLHHIELKNHVFVCKSNLFRINYWLYDTDAVVGRLNVVKKQKERYFEIEVEEDEILQVLALYIVAQAQRIWFLRK